MKITLLVGNGFDLNLGLSTSFPSFINDYIVVNEGDSELLKEFKTSIDKNRNHWSDAEIAFGEYTEEFYKQGKSADEFYECYEDFCAQLAYYLDAQERRIGFDAQEKAVAEAFAKSISIENILKNLSEVQQEQLKSGISQFGGGYEYRFVDFNYTTTLDRCVSLIKNSKLLGDRVISNTRSSNYVSSLIHVHGYTSQSMVLGVNDVGQLANAEIFAGYGEEYIDQLIKIKANGLNEENTDRKVNQLIKDGELFYIYGMSLGDTDKLWWERIVRRMISQPYVHLIIHSHSAPRSLLLPRKNRTWTNKMKNDFITKSGVELNEEQKESVLNRIHIDGKNIFEPLESLKLAADVNEGKETEELVRA